MPSNPSESRGAVLGIDIGGSSVKVALLSKSGEQQTARSSIYERPDREHLRSAIDEAIQSLTADPLGVRTIGVCAPGARNAAGVIVKAVNVPGLEGIDPCTLARDVAPDAQTVNAVSDAVAAAHGYWSREQPRGRLLALVLGTGVGAAVLDDGEPQTITGATPGHIGHIDVGPCGRSDDPTPIAADGGRGCLEAYVGLHALRARFGASAKEQLDRIGPDDPMVIALSRAIRVCLALYRPAHVALLGGLGMALRPRIRDIETQVRDGLTSVARDAWTLTCGDSVFDAAIGAAHLGSDSRS